MTQSLGQSDGSLPGPGQTFNQSINYAMRLPFDAKKLLCSGLLDHHIYRAQMLPLRAKHPHLWPRPRNEGSIFTASLAATCPRPLNYSHVIQWPGRMQHAELLVQFRTHYNYRCRLLPMYAANPPVFVNRILARTHRHPHLSSEFPD